MVNINSMFWDVYIAIIYGILYLCKSSHSYLQAPHAD